MRRRRVPVVILVMILAAVDAAAGGAGTPSGFRMDAYRAPVPDSLAGARVVETADVAALWTAEDAVFIDVLPRPPRPATLPERTFWRPKPRYGIPGSVWLANTGDGALSEEMLGYFEAGLADATDGDKARTVVFYCMRDCWMSWNAARRAIGLGYRDVVWYPDGTDGWEEAGLPLEFLQPLDGGQE